MPSASNATETSKMRSGPWASPARIFSSRSSISRTGRVEPARQIPGQHRVFDAALDPVAAANVDVVMHTHGVRRQAQRPRDLIGVFRHLDRRPDVEQFIPRVPRRDHTESLDRNRGAAPPRHPKRQLPRALREVLIDLAPDEGAIEQDIRSVVGMNRRTLRPQRLLGVEHERKRARTRCRPARPHPRRARGSRPPPPPPIRRCNGPGRPRAETGAPAAYQGRSSADRPQPRAPRRSRPHARPALRARRRRSIETMRAAACCDGTKRHVQHAGELDVGNKVSAANDEAPILAHAPGCRDEVESAAARSLSPPASARGTFDPASRLAASAIASTIWP